MANLFVKLAVASAIYLTIWTFDSPHQEVLQGVSISLFAVAALVCIVMLPVRRYRVSLLEAVLWVTSLYSAMAGVASGADYVWLYSFALLVVLLSLSVVIRALSVRDLAQVVVLTYLAIMLTHLAADGDLLLQSLSITITDQGLLRYTPLGMHANLTGLVYGMFIIVCMAWFLTENTSTSARIAAIAFGAIALVGILGASARASILALGIAIPTLVIRGRLLSAKTARSIAIGAVLAGITLLTYSFDDLVEWLWGMLELSSEERGFGSGGTGRGEMWLNGLYVLFDDPYRLWLGGGYRSAGPDDIGFYVESSYINLWLELGVFFGSAVIVAILRTAFVAIRRIGHPEQKQSRYLLYAAMIMLFACLQSAFNRYLVAIGNPASLVFLMVALRCSISLAGDDVHAAGPGSRLG